MPARPTIFIECTHTSLNDHNTGIGRVVRSVLRHAPEAADEYGYRVVPVAVRQGHLVEIDADEVLGEHKQTPEFAPARGRPKKVVSGLLRAPWRLMQRAIISVAKSPGVRHFVYAPANTEGLAYYILRPWRILGAGRAGATPLAGDVDRYESLSGSILLLLDASWVTLRWRSVDKFKQKNGRVVGVVCDLIPIYYPGAVDKEMSLLYKYWLENLLVRADQCVAISRTVVSEIRRFANESLPANTALPQLSYFHLGSGLDQINASAPVRPLISEIFAAKRNVFIMVGSIAPHKNHAFVLSAFEQYWANGGTGCLLFIGRQAWRTAKFVDYIANHPCTGNKLHLLRDVNDSELDYVYRHASALVIASLQEGFGLPVVEGFQRGLQVVCSDIPVFREIGEDRAWFFGLQDTQMLTDELFAFERRYPPGCEFDRTPMPWLDWMQSTAWLFREIFVPTETSRHTVVALTSLV